MPAITMPQRLIASWRAEPSAIRGSPRRATAVLPAAGTVDGDQHAGAGVAQIRRGVVRTAGGGKIVKSPKSDAGTRYVAIPPHIVPALREHLASHAQHGARGLVFPGANGQHLAHVTFPRRFYPARTLAGRPDLSFHGLRHTGAVLAASTGATLAELMARIGHSTVGASLKYQHAARDRDAVIAGLLSELATGTVTPIRRGQVPGAEARGFQRA